MIRFLRKNIGTIIAAFGFLLLSIITLGDLGEIATEEYWRNVRDNLTAISYVSIALTIIQTVTKFGIGEQALQRGLNTDNTTKKYDEHRELIKSCTEKQIYIPYFLQTYNDRHTTIRKREFLVNNNYTSEKMLYASGNKRLIRRYERIRVNITAGSIKWATTEIVHDKMGKIVPLSAYKKKQLLSSIITSLLLMVALAFITRGLFFNASEEPLWEKFVRLLTYIVAIALGSIPAIIKNYEKGAFGVPNELDEINEIWQEFKNWPVPAWAVKEVEEMNESPKEVKDAEERKSPADIGADIQAEQTQSQDIQPVGAGSEVDISCVGDSVLSADDRELNREYHGNTASAG